MASSPLASEDSRAEAWRLGEDSAGLLRLWNRLRGARPYPGWMELDVSDLKPWMGWLFVLDYPELRSFRGTYAVFGVHLAAWFQQDPTGRSADDVYFGPNTWMLHDAYARAYRHAKPLASVIAVERRDGTICRMRQVVLPFAYRSATSTDRLLGLIRALPPATADTPLPIVTGSIAAPTVRALRIECEAIIDPAKLGATGPT